MAEKVVPYEDKNYEQKKNLYDSISQAFSNMKEEQKASRNIAAEPLQGVTMKLMNGEHLCLTYHRIELGTTDTLARDHASGAKDFLKEVEKELKKSFKKLTKKTLKLKKVKDEQLVDKVSHVQADTSWSTGSSRYGYGNQMGRYLVRDTRILAFDEDTLE